jgi:hypothetical protein
MGDVCEHSSASESPPAALQRGPSSDRPCQVTDQQRGAVPSPRSVAAGCAVPLATGGNVIFIPPPLYVLNGEPLMLYTGARENVFTAFG